VERYALAVLYYGNNGRYWSSRKLRKAFLTNTTVCSWKGSGEYGIRCFPDSEKVMDLYLSEVNATGQIPWEISLMRDMNFLALSENKFSGTIPQRFQNMTKLEFFSVFLNQLSGSLPTRFAPSVKIFDVTYNSFQGRIPETLPISMPSLEQFRIESNALTGTLPTSLGSLPSLEFLSIERTNLSGSINFLCKDKSSYDLFSADCTKVKCSCCDYCCSEEGGCEIMG